MLQCLLLHMRSVVAVRVSCGMQGAVEAAASRWLHQL
jgi:hypothetical protein